MPREINSIIQRVIPILVNSCDIPRKNILADAATKQTTPKRGDIWISKEEVTKQGFEKGIVLLIEVKDENAEPIPFQEMYQNPTKGNYVVTNAFNKAFQEDLENYSSPSKHAYTSEYKNNAWFDALVQGKYKAAKQGLHFFAVSNCIQIYFYHANTLQPIIIKKLKETIPMNFWIKKSLLMELNEVISRSNNILEIKNVETVIDNPSEYEFQRFLHKIHNENVFRFNDETIIDSLLTFVFFKFLQEKMRANNEKLPIRGVLWEDFVKDAEVGEEGKAIIENMHQQLLLLQDKNSGYREAYKEFTPILSIPDDLRTQKENYPIIHEIWKEFSRYYFHGCGFDIYGSIYEEFASPNQKEQLGQFYTRRHISKTLAFLTLKDFRDVENGFKVCDPACGTGGLLTECYNVLKENIARKYGELPKNKSDLLSEKVFFGFDIKDAPMEKAKLNMFFAGDGHTNISKQDSVKLLPKITEENDENGYDVITANPPYGNGSEWYKEFVTWMNSKRHELVFIERMIKALKYGGRFGFVVPDGVLENPRWQDFRKRLLEQVKLEAIISVPVHAFAPYCAQKTYLIIGERRSLTKIRRITKDSDFEQIALDKDSVRAASSVEGLKDLQEEIWMYIIDFDGYANSNKRFPTDLARLNENNEIEFIHNDLFELREKYLKGDDGRGNIVKENQLDLNGDRMGEQKDGNFFLKKSAYFTLNKQINSANWYCLLPETYLRPYVSKHIALADFRAEREKIEKELGKFLREVT